MAGKLHFPALEHRTVDGRTYGDPPSGVVDASPEEVLGSASIPTPDSYALRADLGLRKP